MVWKQMAIMFGLIMSTGLFFSNLRWHFHRYPDRRPSLTWMILFAEIIKTVGGTVLALLWMASSLLLMEGASGFLGRGGSYVAIFMLFPVSVLYYFIMAGFIRIMDAFPAMVDENHSEDL